MRCLFASDIDSDAAAALGSEDEVFDVVAFPRTSLGTAVSARSRLSMESSRSVAKRCRANCRADSVSRFVRSCRLR